MSIDRLALTIELAIFQIYTSLTIYVNVVVIRRSLIKFGIYGCEYGSISYQSAIHFAVYIVLFTAMRQAAISI